MKEKIKIGDIVEGTHGKMRRVADFLPRPEDLILKKAEAPKAKKVTIVLDDFTVDFFKVKAQELGASYQAMIRKLLLEYARGSSADEHPVSSHPVQESRSARPATIPGPEAVRRRG